MRRLQSSTRKGRPHPNGRCLGNLAVAGVDIAIMTLIGVSLFSGQPAFETSRAVADLPAPASPGP
jgi:hypothetical protein